MLKSLIKRIVRNRRGAAFVEYALLVGGIALVAAGAISTFGHKATDIMGTLTVILPGAHTDDNAPLVSGKLIETGPVGPSGAIGIDSPGVLEGNKKDRLMQNLAGITSEVGLVVEAH
jgi:pilus assembly protein Flp/PilA